MPKRKIKKHSKSSKKSETHKIAYVGTAIILIIISGSFLLGILIGFNKGSAGSQFSRPPRIATAREIEPIISPPLGDVRIPILIYHYVEFVKNHRDTIRKSLDIIPPIFENQIKTLRGAGYNFIMAGDLGLYLDGKKPLPQNPVILTFDDGYEDFYTDVFPILKRHNIVATAYIISGVLGRPNYMTLKQVETIASSGLVEIGAHSVHHPNLKPLSKREAESEINKSKEMLESELGIKVVSFAYPYGGYSDETAMLVKKAGFTNAVGTRGGLVVNQQNRFTLFRIHPGIAVGEELLKEIRIY